MPGLPADVPAFVVLPAIDRIPAPRQETAALREFVDRGSRRWAGVPVELPAPLTALLWLLFLANVGVGTWLACVEARIAPCSGLPCTVVTWGGRGQVLLVLAGVCVIASLVAATVTRGLTRAGAGPMAVIGCAAVSGAAAVSGVVVFLLLVALAVLVGVAALVAIAERA